ncbi:MAG: glycosyltransferase family 4 protein [Sorangiineae bacterium]|nr:glycosyltransferase family 4 protein [Polyangiaceae bacterium]MEB2322403.1 glycosyltransferase family 4 protein [Sorangiineae bacterium]
MSPRVLFVSKPIAPPYHDGTKCLVRDVATHLERFEPIVMSVRGAEPPGARVRAEPVYAGAGGFAPSLADNARAALWLLTRSHSDVWHFVFAPNPRTSMIGRTLSSLRRVPVVQTVASPPRSFEGLGRLLFGDVVVAQSRWTRERITEQGGGALRVEIIPPPVGALLARSADATARVRHQLDISEGAPLFVYPGDLETSGGAEAVARCVAPLVQAHPDAVVVFAYREKTAAAARIAEALERRLRSPNVRLVRELPDVLALISGARAVLFPVDDLHGKVDLPIVLLESMALGVPVVVLDHGPLAELEGATKVPLGDDAALVRVALAVSDDEATRARTIEAARAAIRRRYDARVIAGAYERLYEELASRGRGA